MSLIRQEVLDSFMAFTSQFEGMVPYMYCDVKCLVTTGAGNLIDPIRSALSLPWLKVDGAPASKAEIEREWHRVKSIGMSAGPRGFVFTRYLDKANGLHLSDEIIAAIVQERLRADAELLVKMFPDFPDFPAAAQTAILSIAWAVGSGTHSPGLTSPTWPNLQRAIKAQDWRAAAIAGKISATGNPGVVPRNKANQALFLSCCETEPEAA